MENLLEQQKLQKLTWERIEKSENKPVNKQKQWTSFKTSHLKSPGPDGFID